MKAYALSLLVGLLVGAFYSAIKVRSPAPPMIALAGLLGMVIGEMLMPMLIAAIGTQFTLRK